MSLKVGIVGLPNVGKSTLFNALLSRQVANVANYPFCTIEPNVGVVEVPDERLDEIARVTKISQRIPAAIEFVDIAGLVKGAHRGEGLGNQFLAHIREVDLILLILRDFNNPNVTRTHSTNPLEDLDTVLTELKLADLQTLEKYKHPNRPLTKEETLKLEAVQLMINWLSNLRAIHDVTPPLTVEQAQAIKSFNLLSTKPVVAVINTDEEKISSGETLNLPITSITLCAQLETELIGLPGVERRELLRAYGVEEPILDQLIRTVYQTLGLITFFTTTGNHEVRAWPIKKETPAPLAGGQIHSDFQDFFIKVKVVSYLDFIGSNGWDGAKNLGKVRFEGKNYTVQDGDVMEFMIGK